MTDDSIQIGTLTETFRVIDMAREAGYNAVHLWAAAAKKAGTKKAPTTSPTIERT